MVQAFGGGGREPGVVLAPDDPDGDGDGREQGLEIGGVFFVELDVFLEVELLTLLALPLVEVDRQRNLVHRSVRHCAQVRGYDGFEGLGR